MKKIYITRMIPDIGIQNLLKKGYEIDINQKNRPLTKKELISALKKKPYDAVLSLLTDKIDASVLHAVPTAKVFANFAVGFNNFDVEEAKKRGVFLTNTPGGGTETVSEHVFAFILALSRKIVEGDNFIKKGKYTGWDPMLFPGLDLKGKVLGVIGTGKIGADVVHIAVRGFGMKVSYYDVIRNEKLEKEYGAHHCAKVDDLARVADIISVHVPLLLSTRHLVDGVLMNKMKKNVLLVNTSRGPVIDEKALVHALKTGRIAGAALDVFENEPKLAPGLAKLHNVVLTPHIASSTKESRELMSKLASENIISVLETGKPVNPVYS